MSHESYTKWWITSKKQLEDLQIRDKLLQENAKMTNDRNVANHLLGGLYARYSMIVQDLSACLDQNCLIQKRFTMRKLVDAAVIRLNEFRQDLTKVNMSEYHYIDGNLVELRLIPHQIEILDPALIFDRNIDIEDLWTRIKNGETIYEPPPEPERLSAETQAPETGTTDESKPPEEAPPGEATAEGQPTAEAPAETPAEAPAEDKPKKKTKRGSVPKFNPPVKVLTEEEIKEFQRKALITQTVSMIQNHERGRQNRLYYCDLDVRRKLRIKVKEGKLAAASPLEVQEKAALEIQRTWRGYSARDNLKRREISRRYLIGMIEHSWKSKVEQEKYQRTIEHRRGIREQHLRDYIKANLDEKERVLRVIGPGLMEDIGDEIREWFHRWYREIKLFDKYPPEEQGGSILIVRGETMTPQQYLDLVEKLRREKEKAKGKGGKDDKAKQKAEQKKKEAEQKKKEKERAKKEAEAQRKKELKGEFDYTFGPSIANEKFEEGFKEYLELWNERPDSENPEQTYYMDMINEQKCYEMQLELRPKVDELMRLELDLLNEALENDKWKGKKGKKKKGKNKGKKGKKGKGKGKKNKDPTAHRSIEDLFQELVDNGIIHSYPEVHLSEYKGDFSYANWEMRNLEFDPPATLGDVRTAVMMNCILPLGVESMVKPKSVLIAGHRQSGKHLLANAVFYETQCVLFDLSPPILAGKYPGKKGMKMLLHLINKMSRILQPSIIFIDGGEKPFYKKVPNNEKKLEPKKMGGQLFKGIVKPITPDDKVLVLAISGQPFAGKAAGLKKAFERMILIPRTDYGSIYIYWRELLMPCHGIDRNFNVSELAKLTVNYPLPTLKEAAEKILVPARIVQLKYKPLDAHEILEALLDLPEPVEEKEWKKFANWFKNTPLAKKRRQFMAIAEVKRAAEAKGASKKKK